MYEKAIFQFFDALEGSCDTMVVQKSRQSLKHHIGSERSLI